MFSWSRRNVPASITGEENQSSIRHKRSHREGRRRSGTGKLPVLHRGDPLASHTQGALPGLVLPLECVALTMLAPPQTLRVGHTELWVVPKPYSLVSLWDKNLAFRFTKGNSKDL